MCVHLEVMAGLFNRQEEHCSRVTSGHLLSSVENLGSILCQLSGILEDIAVDPDLAALVISDV